MSRCNDSLCAFFACQFFLSVVTLYKLQQNKRSNKSQNQFVFAFLKTIKLENQNLRKNEMRKKFPTVFSLLFCALFFVRYRKNTKTQTQK